MIALPFIYFTLLSFFLYKKKKRQIDLSVIISAMFAVSGFFSILIDIFDLRYSDAVGYIISPTAGIAYCALITMCLLPIAINSNLNIQSVRLIRGKSILMILALVALLWFFIYVIFSLSTFMGILGSDLAEARANVYADNEAEWMTGIPTVLRYLMLPFNMLFGCSWALVFLAFYSRYVQKMPKIYFWIFLLVSLSGPYKAVLGADRSKVAYWIISLVGMYFLYAPILVKKQKKQLIKIGIVIIGILAIYLGMMTIARFGERNFSGDVSGSEGGLITYLGQSYIHFCLFFDNYVSPFPHLGIIFPFISKYIFGVDSGGATIQEEMSLMTGYNCGVFYTFIGQIIMGAGKTIAIIFCILYTFLSSLLLPLVTKKSGARVSSLYLYFAISSVLLLGLFVHYYTSAPLTFSLFAIYFIILISEKSK